MAQEAENVAVVRAVYDAFNREGWDAMLEYAHPDIEPSIPLPKRRGVAEQQGLEGRTIAEG